MKRIFKFISICLVITVICTSSVLYSSATTVVGGDTVINKDMTFEFNEGLILDENISVKEQLTIISNSMSLSEAQKQQAAEKINSIAQEKQLTSTNATKSNTLGYYITRAVPYYKQINSYYCGPATTKQTIHFLTGTSQSQQVIASALGTTTAGTDGMMIASYLNANQTAVYYVDATPASDQAMQNRIYDGLSNYHSIPILRLRMTTGQGWPYGVSTGHFLNVSGFYSGTWSNVGACQYEVTDPYIEYKVSAETDGKYRVTSTAAYDATMNHPQQEFYY